MIVFENRNGRLSSIAEKQFKLERLIQKLFEENLASIAGLQLVKSEFSIKNRRLDSLAFDLQSKSFVIIEYKRDKNPSVVDQGYAYLNLMLANKADFILEYNEQLGKSLKRDDVDWTQTRVMFVSTSFTDYQIEAVDFKDMAIELWEIKQYANDTIIIRPIRKTNATSIKPVANKNPAVQKVTSEIKLYTEEDLLAKAEEETRELYAKFKDAILNLADDIEVRPLKLYVAFKKGRSITDIEIQRSRLKIYINLSKGELDDPKKIAQDQSGKGHWGSGDYLLLVKDDSNLEYIMSLVKQAIYKP